MVEYLEFFVKYKAIFNINLIAAENKTIFL